MPPRSQHCKSGVHGHEADQEHWCIVIGSGSIAAVEGFLIAGANVDGGIVVQKRTNGGRNSTKLARNIIIQN